MQKQFYFAYGSNCNLEQMAFRCPAATKVGPVTLRNYRLTFNGNRRGAGVANIRRKNGASVTGLLWEITPECEESLDRYEGYPWLYTKRLVTVHTEDDKTIKAMAYIMTKKYTSPVLPSRQYLGGIIDGFRQNGMDPEPVLDAVYQTEREGLTV